MVQRMRGAERRAQVLEIAAAEFAAHGLHGASTEAIARDAEITQAYVFRMFGTKKALFLELVRAAFDRLTDAMRDAAGDRAGLDALAAMGAQYYDLLSDRTGLLLQLQGFAACGDEEVREAVRECFARMWDAVADVTGLEPVTVKSFLAFGMLLNSGAALDVEHTDGRWAEGVRTRINAGLFEHITAERNR
ncbi:transcriptional regulator, TetR family [Saccharopolyspora kobensis]|uniref:Transcriptional regulator, TetR family n=1 Tax=Saccharopolyspora kobensis TaxID=146035 RepID=A0A1H6CDA7_9PSEU|nr:TetR/AcrR family transcriptional regulator [Saccharopolyspora kobensis]SEG70625.1 transcriptional regulator, TetR family [Saccharopolyspora kobensis]SFC35431.1 transcriptional regulator, TetR family [Saccharopolyspora kobensis]